MFVSKPDETVKRICAAAFPEWNGRTIKIEQRETIDVRSYWDGGSRDFYAFVRLSDFAQRDIPQQSAFDRAIAGAESAPIPPGFVCVQHSISRGKEAGITIYMNPANAAALLPATTESTLNPAERVVLVATCSLKSSYGGVKNYRLHEAQRDTGITEAAYNEAKAALIARGLLNKAGAVTPEGRNERERLGPSARSLFDLRDVLKSA